MKKIFFALLVTLPAFVSAQVSFPQLHTPIPEYSNEAKDWGVDPTKTPKRSSLHSSTPTSIPGGRVIKTLELKELLDSNKSVVVIDALSSKSRLTIPGAYWAPEAGEALFFDGERQRLAASLEKLTVGDKTKPLVFLCLSSECWLSYNAALRAMELGYQDVIWYRGGTDSWKGANLEMKRPAMVP